MQGNTGDSTVFDEDFDDAPTVLVNSGSARGARAVLALSRGHYVVGWGAGSVGRPIALHHLARLRGSYVLSVSVVGEPRTTLRVHF